MPTSACPLFAAGFDWLEALLPFLFVAFWIMSQMFAAVRRVRGGQRPQPPARIDRPRPRPAGDDAGDMRSELERQIEEFLRQAAGDQPRRPAVSPQAEPARSIGQPPARPKPEAAATRPAAAPTRTGRDRAPGRAREGRRAPRPAADATAAAPAPTRGQELARHVQEAFSHDLAHDRGHDLGHLRGGLPPETQGAEPVAARATPLAAELVELLRSPAATRRAILVRELLERPIDRW